MKLGGDLRAVANEGDLFEVEAHAYPPYFIEIHSCARFFSNGYESVAGPLSIQFPLDFDGHGTHPLSTVASCPFRRASIFDDQGGCFDADILAAFDVDDLVAFDVEIHLCWVCIKM
ncbi:hypothetical protein QJS04_geneDACA001561 [Acorus gramineus]|uniref:Uncharacterized protein n=1 Tax=Acorus gramineus TaxID=55184 RepID=A0AAV9BJ59_ACOGR|nr:hypothetical protein QJS04_geneDACA001561 [Acorus gramineus]